MRRWVGATFGAVALSIGLSVPALAHPLGNFTINHYSQIDLSGGQINLTYVVDYAEIPAFQEKQRLADDPHYLEHMVGDLTKKLVLEIDGRPLNLRMVDRSLRFQPGQGGLDTLRLEVVLSSPAPAGRHSAAFKDDSFPGRLGWKEVVVIATGGATLMSVDVPSQSASNGLRHYPLDMLQSPLAVTAAHFSFLPGVGTGLQAPAAGLAAGPFRAIQDRFAALIDAKALSPSLILFSLLAACAFGALHALSPGHGKAVMAGYLLSTRAGPRRAMLLGLTITVTHTVGVFGLGLLTLYAGSLITPETLYPWLTLLSGILILAIGAGLLWSRARAAMQNRHRHEQHPHRHGGQASGGPGLMALGVSGGLIPCPSALVVLLSAISLGRLFYGMLLIVGFSVGLALTLTGIGMALAAGVPRVGRLSADALPKFGERALRWLPTASAAAVTAAGLGLTAQALPGIR